METLQCFNRYNSWANRRVFDLCRSVDPALLRDDAGGTTSSIAETLVHLVSVEDSYLAMLQGRDLREALGPREEYQAHDLAWFLHRGAALAEGYAALLSEHDAAWLERSFAVPWFTEVPLSMRDGVLQVFTHSTQHRSQVCWVLGAHGVTVPEMDYIQMLMEEQRTAAV